MKYHKIILICLLLLSVILPQTEVTLTGSINRFVTYYISSMDITTGESDVQIFNYLLECTTCELGEDNKYTESVPVGVEFEVSMKSPSLGMDEEETIALFRTEEPFDMWAPIRLDNRDMTVDNLELYDVNGEVVPIKIEVDDENTVEITDLEDMFAAIVQTGSLPDGIYRFRISLYDENENIYNSDEEVINVVTPQVLQLIGPGGNFDELDQTPVFTNYPVFQWESETFTTPILDNCDECGFYLRVAEFRCEDHATIDDAIEDITTLPLSQSEDWEYVGNSLSFMYPTAGAVDLIPGGIYVWQVQKRISTTSGIEELISPIYTFQIQDLGSNPLMQAIQEMLPEDVFRTLTTPCGPLTGYTSTGNVKLDGEDSDVGTVNTLVEEFKQGNRTIISTEIQ